MEPILLLVVIILVILVFVQRGTNKRLDTIKHQLDPLDPLRATNDMILSVQMQILACLEKTTEDTKRKTTHEISLSLGKQIESMAKDGQRALKIAITSQIPLEQAEREVLRLYQESKLTQSQCETVLDRGLTKDEII